MIVPINVFANDSSLFAYTSTNSEVENFAKENVIIFITSGNHYEKAVFDTLCFTYFRLQYE